MTVSSIDAGKTICELSKWQTSNLRLQKLLYIAHMYHIGITKGEDLIEEDFYVWQHGPVEPELYHYCKGFGSDYIPNIFPVNGGVRKNGSEFKILKKISDIANKKKLSNKQLVDFTHWEKGAWFRAGERWKHRYSIIIPREMIKEEYNYRVEKRTQNEK